MLGLTHREAVETLARAPPMCRLQVQRALTAGHTHGSEISNHGLGTSTPEAATSPSLSTDTLASTAGGQSPDDYSTFVTKGVMTTSFKFHVLMYKVQTILQPFLFYQYIFLILFLLVN